MTKECVAEMTRNYTASEFIKAMHSLSKVTGDTVSKDFAVLVEGLVEKEYGYNVTMEVLCDEHPLVKHFIVNVLCEHLIINSEFGDQQ